MFRPNFDTATAYGYVWLGEIAEIAKSLGHDVLDLSGDQCTPQAFYDAMNNFKPELVICVGHGNANNYSGQDRDLILTGCTNDQVMAGSQSFMVSCLMGQELAPSMVKKGAVTVLAFTSEFVWLINPDYANDIANDPYAKYFKEAIVEQCRSLLSGATWQQIYDLGVSIYNKGIAYWFNSSDFSAGEIVSALTQDRDSMIILGEKTIGPSGIMVSAGLQSLISIPVGLLLIGLTF